MNPIISIPQPCNENWDAMMPQDKGRHCEACRTIVTDFTKMTDAEIINHLKISSSKTCGRFLETQLNRELVEPLQNHNWFSIPKLSAAASILFSLLQLPVLAQNKNEIKTEQTQVLKNDSMKIDTLKQAEINKLPVRNLNSVVPIYQGTPCSNIQIDGKRRDERVIVGGAEATRTSISIKHLTPWQRFKRKIRRLF